MRLSAASLVLTTCLACVRASPQSIGRSSGGHATSPTQDSEEIWLAVLRSYASRAVPTEGDVTLSTNRMLGAERDIPFSWYRPRCVRSENGQPDLFGILGWRRGVTA